MTKTGRQSLIISSLLAAAGIYVLFVFFPIVGGMQITGHVGRYADGEFMVTEVFANSPAYLAGLKQGDAVLEQAGHPIAEWYQ